MSHIHFHSRFPLPSVFNNVCMFACCQDLTAIGITKPSARKKLKSEIGKLMIHDGIPDFKPVSVAF